MSSESSDRVSRRRYEREKQARIEAEKLLEDKSRELFLANQQLSDHSARLEDLVSERTAELRVALKKAEDETAVRTRFIATMSHEIRTPLGGLLGMIDLLSMDETDREKLELLKNAQQSGAALKRIVNDVLDFSKMEADLFVFENEAVDLRAIVDGIVSLARINTAVPNREIRQSVASDVPKLFKGDATRIRQVISNLVNNASRYSKSGPILLRARRTDHPMGALLRVEVEDFGIGIPEDKLDSLFKDFSQVSNSLSATAQGTGLGLAISKRIIEGCGGRIGVESTPNVGSTFWFDLPVAIIDPSEQVAEKAKADAQDDNDIALAGKRVLLAEDNAINQKLLLTYLRRMEIDTDLAENGRIALDKFAPGKYDLLLMDIAMPEMDGLEAIRRIREIWNFDSVPPIVVLTAHVMDAIKEDADKAGVDAVLCKPIPFDELKETVQKVVATNTATGITKTEGARKKDAPAVPFYVQFMSKKVVKDLMDSFSGEELSDLVYSYLDDARGLLDNIDHAFERGDSEQVSRDVHSLKGASRLLGFDEIAEKALRIESDLLGLSSEAFSTLTGSMRTFIDQVDAGRERGAIVPT